MFKQILQHKLIMGIILILVSAGGYFGYQGLTKDTNTTHYVTTVVKKGALITSISGSGQVSISNQIDIKPKVSGDVVYVGVENGQKVKAGDLLFQLDTTEAEKAVRDDEINLESAKLSLEQLKEPADQLSILQAENALSQAKTSKENAEANLEKAYEDGFNAISSSFLDLPTIITGLSDILYAYDIAKSETTISDYSWNISVLKNSVEYDDRYQLEKFISSAETNYKSARAKYDENFENYKNASRYSDKKTIERLLNETVETTKSMADTTKSEMNMLDYWVDYRSQNDLRIYNKVTEYQSDLESYTSKTNSHLSSLLSIQQTIENSKQAIINAGQSIAEKTESLNKLKAGPDELEIKAKELTIKQRENALQDAKDKLSDYYIRAPFDGIVTNINVEKGESVSSNKVLATIISKQKIAEITLNEVDIAKVKVGQKANITFDAVDDLNITGKVVEIDTLGEVTQGVVEYGVKISFDTQDKRVKPGMSLSANIITEAKQNTLLVPNQAVKIDKTSRRYVELLKNNIPVQQPVEIGLSNDTTTEILEGLKEGDIVITQAITSNSTSNQSQQNTKGGGFDPGMMRMIK